MGIGRYIIFGGMGVVLGVAVKTLKKRIFKVCQSDGTQCFIVYFRLIFTLKNDGWELFVIAYKDKFTNGIIPRHTTGTKDAQ